MKSWTKTLSRIAKQVVVCLALSKSVHSAVIFEYSLSTAGHTSAGVYTSDGVLLKTLWSNVEKEAGAQPPVTWDGYDNEGNLIESEDIHLKVINHNVTYTWEGVVGNTGDEQTSDSKPRAFRPLMDLVFSSSGEGFAAPDYNEGQSSAMRFNQGQPNKWARALPPDYRFSTQLIAADHENIYFARNAGSSPESFLFKKLINKRNWQDPDGWLTEYGVEMETELGKPFKNLINPGTGRCFGLDVQIEGELLAASYHELDTIRVYNKTTGQHLYDLSIDGPRRLRFDKSGRLWVIAGDSQHSGSVFMYESLQAGALPTLAIDALQHPLDLAFSPDGQSIVLVEAGELHQVFAYDIESKELLWTLGQEGGYAANGPSAAPDKFHFVNTHYGFEAAFVTYSPNGNLWVGDMGNFRTLVFGPNRELVDEIMYIPHSYIAAVDPANPTRVFSGWLEFEVDYSKPLQEGWKLIRNWIGNVPLAWQRSTGLHTVVSVDLEEGPVTLAIADLPRTGRWVPRAIAILDLEAGIIDTGNDCKLAMALYKGGHLREWRDSNKMEFQVIEERRFLGLNAENLPVWDAPVIIANAPKGSQDPYYKGAFSSRSGSRWPITDSGKVIFFDQEKRNVNENPGFHLGAIQIGSSSWSWRASYSGVFETVWGSEYSQEELGTVVNYDGSYDDTTSHQYGGNRVMTAGKHIIYGYHGEFWRNAQANQWLHFTDDGLFVGQFGSPNYPWKGYPFAGVMGNAFSPEMVAVDGHLYVYMNDESAHGGVHQWKVSGLDTMETYTLYPIQAELAFPDNWPDFNSWIAGFDLATEDRLKNADPDLDGLNNEIEYIYGRDPTVFDAQKPFRYNLSEAPSKAFTITFVEQKVSLDRVVEWRFWNSVSDPTGYTASPMSQVVLPDDDSGETTTEFHFPAIPAGNQVYVAPEVSQP